MFLDRPDVLQRLLKQCRLLKSNSLLNTDWRGVRTVLFWHPDRVALMSGRLQCLSVRHCGASERLQRLVRTVVQEPILTWKLHEIFIDLFLETCDHTRGMKWETVHITWRLWIEPIILLKRNHYIKCFCQLECCQYKILTTTTLQDSDFVKQNAANTN
jgi:hypothetical protein